MSKYNTKDKKIMVTIDDLMCFFDIQPPTEIIYDGKIHRFKNDGDDNKNSWYVAYDNGKFQSGAFGCWKLDVSEKFCSIEHTHLTTKQKQRYAKQLAEQKHIAELEKIKQQRYVQGQVNERFNCAITKGINAHPYLQNKGVKSHGLRIDNSLLLVPMFTVDGEIASIQTISTSGDKFYTKGGRVKGCFFPIGAPEDILILCEGYATGASIHEATSEPVAVCFNSGNIKEVAKELSAKHPNTKIIIAGDDDHKREQNIGRIKAVEAAKHIGSTAVFPKLDTSYNEGCTDFNDLHRLCGLNEVKKQINKAIHDSERATNRGSFVFYDSFYKSMKHLGCEDKSELLQAICEYGLFEKQTKLSPHIESLFELVKPQLEANFRKRKNGKKGGRPSGS
jgi:putative DNA primase/helicase